MTLMVFLSKTRTSSVDTTHGSACTIEEDEEPKIKHEQTKENSTTLESHVVSIINDTQGKRLQRELALWRDSFSIANARAARPGIFTVAELAVGGCLSALSSIRCGFRHVWTTETDPHKATLAESLTRAPCLGDTFSHDYKQLRAQYGHVSYLKSGQPCKDWSSPGPHTGRGKGTETGWMYNAQSICILDLEPDVVCLEQVAHIMKVDRTAVTDLTTQLETKYVVHTQVVNVWWYGDVSNRERFMIVAIHKKFGPLANEYETATRHLRPHQCTTGLDGRMRRCRGAVTSMAHG